MSAAAPLHDLAREHLGNQLMSQVAKAFTLMGVAEEEIDKAKKRWPRRARSLHAAFGILDPHDLASSGELLYRAHCRELLGRVMRREDVKPGTDAEVIFCLMRASLCAPPDSDHALAYGKLFARCFPEQAHITEGLGHEYVPGRADEIIATLRRKIGDLTKRAIRSPR